MKIDSGSTVRSIFVNNRRTGNFTPSPHEGRKEGSNFLCTITAPVVLIAVKFLPPSHEPSHSGLSRDLRLSTQNVYVPNLS